MRRYSLEEIDDLRAEIAKRHRPVQIVSVFSIYNNSCRLSEETVRELALAKAQTEDELRTAILAGLTASDYGLNPKDSSTDG